MGDVFQEVWSYLIHINFWELTGLLFGLVAVLLLIKENILTWPAGIIYCLVSFYVFWQAKLYQDFGLTFFFLVMNIYGWYAWLNPKTNDDQLKITKTTGKTFLLLAVISLVYILGSGWLFSKYTDASLPYGDATTTGLSFVAMWMTARKKLENWVLWFIVDVLAAGIYFYKEIYFYSALYFVYIFMAVAGYIAWKKLYKKQFT